MEPTLRIRISGGDVQPFLERLRHAGFGARLESDELVVPPKASDGEERFLRAFEESPIGMAITSTEGRFLRVNPALCEILGYSSEGLVGKRFAEFTHPDDVSKNLQDMREMLAGKRKSAQFEKRYLHRTGRTVSAYLSVALIRDGDDQPLHFVTQVMDITRRRESEEILREREEQLRGMMESALDAIIFMDSDGLVTGWNPQAGAIFGWSAEEAVGRPMADLVVPERHRDAHRRGLQRYLQSGKSAILGRRLEFTAVRRDGQEFPVELCIAPIRVGGRTQFSGFLRDIGERKRAEERLSRVHLDLERQVAERTAALSESEMRWRSLVSNAPDIILTLDRDARIQSVNRTVAGYTVEGVIGTNAYEYIQPEYHEVFRRAFEGVLRTGEAGQFDLEAAGPNGNPSWYSTRIGPVRMEGAVVGAVLISTDITERRIGEEALRESDNRFRQLAENINEVFWISEPRSQKLLYVSPTYEAIWGQPAARALEDPQTWIDSILLEDRPQVFESFERQFREKTDIEFRIRRPDRTVRWIRNRGFPIRNERGEVYRVAGIAEDVTDRKKAEEEVRLAADSTRRAYEALKRTQNRLIQAEKLASVGMVMAGIAHEINNPINVIYGNLFLLREALRQRRLDRRALLRMLSDARAAAEDARRVVEEFRHFARDREGEEAIDLRQVVREAVTQIRMLCGPGIRVTTKLEAVPPSRVFPGQLRRALLNLLKNAVEAVSGKGRVRVELAHRKGEAVIEVEDDGPGIPKEILSRVFEPFFTTKEPGRGFGLGLSLAAAVVQNHGGRVGVKSRPGRGSRFTLRIPVRK